MRRAATVWTRVQGGLAPLQFVVFAVSLVLVLRFLATGSGHAAAAASIVAKTAVLYAIMVTGAVWEKAVFGRYLFAAPFFWEDAVGIAVIGLHSACLWALWSGAVGPAGEMALALAAYAAYVLNAGQFLFKLRRARAEAAPAAGGQEAPA